MNTKQNARFVASWSQYMLPARPVRLYYRQPVMSPTNAQLRQFIMEHFSDEELVTLCFDYFPEVQQNFSDGQTKNSKALALIGYCDSRGLRENLLVTLAQERASAWQALFAAPVETARRTASALPAALPAQRNPRQIFLSHATANAEFAHKLAADLRAEDWAVWIAPDSIAPGEKWLEAIDRGLEGSSVFVVALTPEAVASTMVRDETYAALEMANAGDMRLVMVEVASCRLPALWRHRQYIPFRTSYEAGLDALLGWLDSGELTSTEVRTHPAGPPATPTMEEPEAEKSKQLLAEIEALVAGQIRYVTANQASEITTAVKDLANKLGAQTGRNEFGAVYGELYRKFDVASYKMLPADRFQEAITWLEDWSNALSAESNTSMLDRRIHTKTGIELIRIPAGPFLYGSADSDIYASEDEKPQVSIELPEYWIGRTPVTNAQYKRFLDANSGHRIPFVDQDWALPYNWDQNRRTYPANKADHPVVLVSWDDAQAFCDWAGLQLPTEQEWEKAARGDKDGRMYPWGNIWMESRCNTFEAKVSGTSSVGIYSPMGDSPYDLQDIVGNVREWTDGWYSPQKVGRVLRGGSWIGSQRGARISSRHVQSPDTRSSECGFRVSAPAVSGS